MEHERVKSKKMFFTKNKSKIRVDILAFCSACLMMGHDEF